MLKSHCLPINAKRINNLSLLFSVINQNTHSFSLSNYLNQKTLQFNCNPFNLWQAIGYGVVAVTFALQPVMKWACDHLTGLWRIGVCDAFLFFSFIGTVNVWRGIWQILDLLFMPGLSTFNMIFLFNFNFFLKISSAKIYNKKKSRLAIWQSVYGIFLSFFRS